MYDRLEVMVIVLLAVASTIIFTSMVFLYRGENEK